MAETSAHPRPAPGNTGNPRVTVAFPFSRIEIRDPEPALADLASLVRDLAEYVAALPHETVPGGADHLVQEARRLATSLGAD